MNNIIDITDLVQFAPVGSEIEDIILQSELTHIENIVLPGIFRNKTIVENMLAMDPDEAGASNSELWSFWKVYVKPVAALGVFIRLVETHGMAFNGTGIMVSTPGNNTATPVTENQRATILRKYRSTFNSYVNGLRYEFQNKEKTFDGIEYEVDERFGDGRATGGMSALNNVNENIAIGKPFRL